ncbi:hypothetical protein [Acidithiobacillus ferrooxidans]|nr:hypothetical protein [Acidithiobacillus ferrooxidans]MBU2816765.1 hypothetical protein [Acidithiobacillus ferrooxidans]MCR1341573.1 hypothetical protein [Acidithiobacillus ferrooxidans]QZT51694.1 hypothetical protein K7B00_10870 [Acidithiobacillus ferrooxidans]BDB14819.1 hypothetical protein ANFP_21390 [Acidithiobacillus ferrooxidans]
MSQSYLQLQRTFSVAKEMSDDAVDYEYEIYQAFRNLMVMGTLEELVV